MRTALATLATITATVTACLAVSSPASAAPSLRFHGTQYDSPGKDTRTNASLNKEWISLVNTGSKAVNLEGYTLRDKSKHVYTFGDVTIAGKGGRIWLHTGTGTDKSGNVYWGSGNYVWNNTGDTAYLRKPSSTTNIDTCTWKYKKNRTWIAC
jgi:hypothetical protein